MAASIALPARRRPFRLVARAAEWLAPAFVVLSVFAGSAIPQSAPDDSPAVAELPPETYAGLFVAPLPAPLAAQLRDLLPEGSGLVVAAVVPNSPAARAGLEPHDVLVQFAGEPVRDAARLRQAVRERPPGKVVQVEIIRRAARRDVRVTLESREKAASAPSAPSQLARVSAGFQNDRGAAASVRPTPVVVLNRNAAADPQTLTVRPDGALSVSTTDGRTFRAAWRPSGDDPDRPSPPINVTLDSLAQRAEAWPKAVRDELRQIIERAPDGRDKAYPKEGRAAASPGVRLRLQPRLRGVERAVRLVLESPGRDGERRVLQLDHTFDAGRPATGATLLEHEAVKTEIDSLPPAVRGGIEEALRRLKLPEVRVDVQSSL